MSPDTHVRAHSGPTNCRLRIHLGLDVPKVYTHQAAESHSRMRIVNEYVTWKNGEMIIFDDSFDHEVWHKSPLNKSRLVLIMDMWHPELSEYQIAIS